MENRLIIGSILIIFAAVVFGLIFGIGGLAAVIIILIIALWYSNRNKKRLLNPKK
jgi:ABC-type multidrug transport system permease subunit